jgi:hypothetical protein
MRRTGAKKPKGDRTDHEKRGPAPEEERRDGAPKGAAIRKDRTD